MEAYGKQAGGGYKPDCQLGKRGTRQAWEKGREMKEGKASMKERPFFQAG